MKALTLTQPWASLTAIGAKTIETRSWGTPYRGWVAIHAAKGFPEWAQELCDEWPFADRLRDAGYPTTDLSTLPRGAIVAVAKLDHVGKIARYGGEYWIHGWHDPVDDEELEFGDYSTGRYGWVFTNVRPLPEPIPCRGMLGLWELPHGMATGRAG